MEIFNLKPFLKPQEKKKKHTFHNSRKIIMMIAYFYVRNGNTFVLNLKKRERRVQSTKKLEVTKRSF